MLFKIHDVATLSNYGEILTRSNYSELSNSIRTETYLLYNYITLTAFPWNNKNAYPGVPAQSKYDDVA